MQFQNGGIGFFDSGIGGLSVLATCKNILSDLPFYYLGDNARAPYGNLTVEKIRAYTYEALSLFQKLQPRAVVLACNTVTAVCVEEMRRLFPFPIIGTEPAVLPAMRNGGTVGVLATQATQASARFICLKERAESCEGAGRLLSLPCPQLAGLIEENVDNPKFSYAPYLPKAKLNGVVLGCTHYVFIKKQIEDFYGCPAYDGNEGVACRVKALVKNAPNPANGGGLNVVNFPFSALSFSDKKSPIFFLGGQNIHNKRIYEQMFVLK